ncbi:MAG TPA: prepilin-type N-terminal cleavage/methylation domain-containing protein [Kiritimatiellia bacterium]|nr:prepilin-type N-terminal cleavage/methylation domain-containing protein [Kiritimatiellia bacterium]
MRARVWRKIVIPPAKNGRRGFTLIEVLVVVVIAALAAGIALPGFIRTMRGAQLRTASRTVLMAHKYARSTAVLRQVPMAILLDRETSELEIITMHNPAGARDKFLDSRQNRATDAVLGTQTEQEAKPDIQTELVRKLGRDVNIDSFRSELGGQEFQGVYWIMYHPNGMSDGFELTLTDKNNRMVTIVSDAISGKVEAKHGRF